MDEAIGNIDAVAVAAAAAEAAPATGAGGGGRGGKGGGGAGAGSSKGRAAGSHKRGDYVTKTNAKLLYCLTDKELATLTPLLKQNPRARSGPPMQLFLKAELERLAAGKWGSAQRLEEERAQRARKREENSIRRFLAPAGAGAAGAAAAPDAPPQQQQGDVEMADAGQQQQQGGGGGGAAAASGGGLAGLLGAPPLVAERVRVVKPWPAGAAPAYDAGQGQQQKQQQAAMLQQEDEARQQGLQQQRVVLYWMGGGAVRGHENPALDVARAQARRLGLPLIAACFLLGCHPYASARRYAFWMEGLRDAQAELREQGTELLVYLDGVSDRGAPSSGANIGANSNATATTSGSGGGASGGGSGSSHVEEPTPATATAAPPAAATTAELAPRELPPEASPGWGALLRLASRAALVVAEDMPVPPEAQWVERVRDLNHREASPLAASLPQDAALWAVDTACCLPMQLTKKAYERAAYFRSATDGARRHRIAGLYRGSSSSGSPPAGAAGSIAGFLRQQQQQQQQEGQGGQQQPAEQGGRQQQQEKGEEEGVRGVPAVGGVGRRWDERELGWRPLNLTAPGLDIAGLVAQSACLDHSVPPVAHLQGGSKAGYARWAAFKAGGGLQLYAARRNDAMQRGGVSRMSAYLRFGMVSPFRIAREASADRSAGAAKFLDELLTWREVSYSFAHLKRAQLGPGALRRLEPLPEWAQRTLREHAADARPGLRSAAQIEEGATGDAFWDAAQQQLVATGELHNNVRMTWGKALLPWMRCPGEALLATVHLNHKYALDGCDPCSYGGVLWCFGLWDGPRAGAATPVTGALRVRPTSTHARRLDPAAYRVLPP